MHICIHCDFFELIRPETIFSVFTDEMGHSITILIFLCKTLRRKIHTRCARCPKLGHWARECSEGNRGQRNDERYDRRAGRPEDNPQGFIAVAGHTERRPFFFGASWTLVALDPGEVLWDTGVQEAIVEEQQLRQWCTLLAEYGLQAEWSQEKPESASSIGGVHAATRCCLCVSRIGRVQRGHPHHGCGAGCPTTSVGGIG